MTTESLSERVSELEKSVKRAAETIALLRKERDGLQARIAVLEGDRGELQALKQERREVLAQVDSILKELEKLDL
jgi:FtsZ-binding cell division protein ZapB